MELPEGYWFAGAHCGIKASAPDLALIVSVRPCVAAGVYTTNLVRAACIDWNRSITPAADVRAIVVNSGNANACTGKQGVADNEAMAASVAGALGPDAIGSRQVLVLSTGVIGRPMPIQTVQRGIAAVSQSLSGDAAAFEAAASAILTTDHSRKTASAAFSAAGRTYRIAAMAKGAGMIGPAMATMLAVIVTDYPLSPSAADGAIREAVDQSFNRISVEGHMSTNDAAILLAPPAGRDAVAGRPDFQASLNAVCLELARKIPTDGEGATHLIEIRVSGAGSDQAADRIARTIALSNLVKTAVAGADPNWGRIVSAAGFAGVPFDVRDVSLTVNGIPLFERGEPVVFDPRETSRSIRQQRETLIALAVGRGPGAATHYTSDLTADYVRLNAEYTT